MDTNERKTAANILGRDTKKGIRRKSADSSDIRSIGFDEARKQLTVRFHSGPEVYLYSSVPKQVYTRLMNATSIGKAFAEHVKGVYKFRVAK
jgi:KTSC domain-containing protein